MLYMIVVVNNCRHEIIAKKPPDDAIKVFASIEKLFGID